PPPAAPDWGSEVFDPRSLARSSLRWDAAYLALGGSLTVMFAAPLGDHLGLAAWFVALAGFGVLAWSGIVWGMARGDQWWGPTATVAGINLLCFVLLTAWAASTSAGGGGAVVGLAAAQVLAFAVVQAVSVVRGWPARLG
ncbi:MAG: hypothetical protein MUP76_07325, partial [Acidimicrobiia bacterium]|nr:hypothetical protein [Acidimicrobiia bacterium]